MVVPDVTPLASPAAPMPAPGVLLRLRVRLAGARLDTRLAAGEEPSSDVLLDLRATQLASRGLRDQLAGAIEHVTARRPASPGCSAAVPVDAAAVRVARPALEQLATALRSRRSVRPRGVALARALLTDPTSALYRASRPEELYERAREALLALGTDTTTDSTTDPTTHPTPASAEIS